MIDLAHAMLKMICVLSELQLRSHEVTNPLSWVLVNDPRCMYIVWDGVITVFPASMNAPAPTHPL